MAKAWSLTTKRCRAAARGRAFRQSAAWRSRGGDADTVLVRRKCAPQSRRGLRRRIAAEIEELAVELNAAQRSPDVDEVDASAVFGRTQSSAAEHRQCDRDGRHVEGAVALGPAARDGSSRPDPMRRKRIIDARSYFDDRQLRPIARSDGAPCTPQQGPVRWRGSSERDNAQSRRALGLHEAPPRERLLGSTCGRNGCLSLVSATGETAADLQALASNGVLIVPGDGFEMPDHMRIGFGAQAAGFDDALAIMAELCGRD